MTTAGAGGQAREVLAVRFGHRVTTRAESYLNFHLYGEPDADLDIDYYFWVIRDGGGVVLVDTGFAPEAGDRRLLSCGHVGGDHERKQQDLERVERSRSGLLDNEAGQSDAVDGAEDRGGELAGRDQ